MRGSTTPNRCFEDAMTLEEKLAAQRLRMDGMWAAQHELTKTLANEQTRCTHLATQLQEAVTALHDAQTQLADLTTKYLELLNKG